jgi:hypothetical protein
MRISETAGTMKKELTEIKGKSGSLHPKRKASDEFNLMRTGGDACGGPDQWRDGWTDTREGHEETQEAVTSIIE